jgi:hypothetical protein
MSFLGRGFFRSCDFLAKTRKATLPVAKLDRLSRFIATLTDSRGFDLRLPTFLKKIG